MDQNYKNHMRAGFPVAAQVDEEVRPLRPGSGYQRMIQSLQDFNDLLNSKVEAIMEVASKLRECHGCGGNLDHFWESMTKGYEASRSLGDLPTGIEDAIFYNAKKLSIYSDLWDLYVMMMREAVL